METVNNTGTVSPLKRHPALVHFSKDHHFGLLLVWKIRQGIKKNIEGERIGNYLLFFFSEDLKAHFQEEESHLFPLLPAQDKLVRQALEEHRKLYALAEEIQNHLSDTNRQQNFAGLLEAHIRFEERSLFPHIEEKLTATGLEEIIRKSGVVACDIDDRWQDQFWK